MYTESLFKANLSLNSLHKALGDPHTYYLLRGPQGYPIRAARLCLKDGFFLLSAYVQRLLTWSHKTRPVRFRSRFEFQDWHSTKRQLWPLQQWSVHCTEVRFSSFFSGGFIIAIVVNPPERKLAKRTSTGLQHATLRFIEVLQGGISSRALHIYTIDFDYSAYLLYL